MSEFLTTELAWDDLAVDGEGREELDRLVARVRDRERAVGSGGGPGGGLRALFDGPPGSGRKAAAALVGEAAGRSVYRVDLSKIISKYIGETEKNLDAVFEEAQAKDWILLFDEADALFGRRSESRDADDRAADQQVAYLRQRIEGLPGVVILAADLRSEPAAAPSRWLASTVHFRHPGEPAGAGC